VNNFQKKRVKIYSELFIGHKLLSISRWASLDEPHEQILDHVLEIETSDKTVTLIAHALSPWFFLGDALHCDPFNLSWAYKRLNRVPLIIQPFEVEAIDVVFSKQYGDVVAVVLKGMGRHVLLAFQEDAIHILYNSAELKNGAISISKYSHFKESELEIIGA